MNPICRGRGSGSGREALRVADLSGAGAERVGSRAAGVHSRALGDVGAHLVGRLLGQSSPGLGPMVAASMVAAVFALAFVVALAYYGIPIATSFVDFV